jgi:hypothetical protein
MKTTVDLRDDLMLLARDHAARHSLTLRAVLEEALQNMLLSPPAQAEAFALKVIAAPANGVAPDLSEILREQREAELLRL